MVLNNTVLLAHRKFKKKNKNKTKKDELDIKFIEAMVQQFCERNGLETGSITIDTLKLIYRVCSYEMAHSRHSPWCRLFTNSELQVIEYLCDMQAYKTAYTASPQVGAIVMADLCRKLEAVVRSPPGPGKTKATLYFTHDGLLKRLIGYLRLFSRFPAHQQHGGKLFLPLDRQWRSSYLIPFGANLAVILYRSETKYKLLTLFNEIPVTVAGCRSELIDLDEFLAYYRNADSIGISKQ